jgi:hypothetical protein
MSDFYANRATNVDVAVALEKAHSESTDLYLANVNGPLASQLKAYDANIAALSSDVQVDGPPLKMGNDRISNEIRVAEAGIKACA